ncbi:MAG TPA: hypothetical protein VEC57_14875 [Candidatus Limnocylindrales bacterium]|nr:hypothetical protein [Candidatus Limnocylindrales bacterium]
MTPTERTVHDFCARVAFARVARELADQQREAAEAARDWPHGAALVAVIPAPQGHA